MYVALGPCCSHAHSFEENILLRVLRLSTGQLFGSGIVFMCIYQEWIMVYIQRSIFLGYYLYKFTPMFITAKVSRKNGQFSEETF